MMKSDKVLLDHGSGGKISHRMTQDLLLPAFNNPILSELNDGAIFDLHGLRLGFSTDSYTVDPISYTVDPIFFPGGNIGELAVYGTVNDLAMCGAEPAYLSAALIIEEGFALDQLEAIVSAMSQAAAQPATPRSFPGEQWIRSSSTPPGSVRSRPVCRSAVVRPGPATGCC